MSSPLERVRELCLRYPGALERPSHGEPTFFIDGRVFVMFANNHHGDGRIAVWLPVPGGFQTTLIEADPKVYFRPPYVGPKGWVGIEVDRIGDEILSYHVETAWELVRKKPKPAPRSGNRPV